MQQSTKTRKRQFFSLNPLQIPKRIILLHLIYKICPYFHFLKTKQGAQKKAVSYLTAFSYMDIR